MKTPAFTGVPFNDAYRYMDWLLTVPLLLIEILLVMKLDEATFSSKVWVLVLGAAMMIVPEHQTVAINPNNLGSAYSI